jgi:hypothetical protein
VHGESGRGVGTGRLDLVDPDVEWGRTGAVERAARLYSASAAGYDSADDHDYRTNERRHARGDQQHARGEWNSR